MRICIPIKTARGAKAEINAHFGSAPYFAIYDTEKDTFEVIRNSNSHHVHGMCNPLNALDTLNINAIVCTGIGARAISKLNEGGIRVYRAQAETAEEIVKRYKENALKEISIEDACTHHDCSS